MAARGWLYGAMGGVRVAAARACVGPGPDPMLSKAFYDAIDPFYELIWCRSRGL